MESSRADFNNFGVEPIEARLTGIHNFVMIGLVRAATTAAVCSSHVRRNQRPRWTEILTMSEASIHKEFSISLWQ